MCKCRQVIFFILLLSFNVIAMDVSKSRIADDIEYVRIRAKMSQRRELTKNEQSFIKPYFIKELNRACDEHNFDKSIAYRIVNVESRFKYDAISKTGAEGLMQFTNITLKDYNHNVYDYKETISHGIKYLSDLYKLFLNDGLDKDDAIVLAVASYNCGRGRIIRDKYTIKKLETKYYIKKIFGEQTLIRFTR